jgi:dihydroflavonol-4-reductase
MVVVTGATGHIGNVLVRKLLCRNGRVRVLAFPSEDLLPLDGLNVEIIEGDVRQVGSLIRAFSGCEVAYHLAGIISILPGYKNMRRIESKTSTQG